MPKEYIEREALKDVTISDISLKLDEINRYLKALCDVWGAKFRT